LIVTGLLTDAGVELPSAPLDAHPVRRTAAAVIPIAVCFHFVIII
jgi:hypothetical protein